MRFLLIPDKFKGSLTSEEVAAAIQEGVEQVRPRSVFHFTKVSDGGDGFLDAVEKYTPCIKVQTIDQNPLGKQKLGAYLYQYKQETAYVELANASGMDLLLPDERDPLRTSTYGTGLQIKDAIQKGARKIYIGLGGSATNDGGIGIAQALGFSFFDARGAKLEPTGESLVKIVRVDTTRVLAGLDQVAFFAVNDVSNPLFGEQGAAFVYAAQKGASQKAIETLDRGLRQLHAVVKNQLHTNNALLEGAGAAGGTAFGLKSFLNAEFVKGTEFIVRLSGVETLLASEKFDYIITGEGKIDVQTLHGKLIQGVLQLGKKHHLPVIAVCGQLDIAMVSLKEAGITDVIEIQNTRKPLAYSIKHAHKLIVENTAAFFTKKV